MKSAVEYVSRRVSVENLLGHAPHSLSGGQKQRVSLAGVMVDEVKIFLFDEPLANLDPATGKQAIELIDRVQKETGAAVIIIEHRLEDVLWRKVDRIILMDEGRILADQSPDELLCSPLLAQAGIREPLYLTAVKYAGVKVLPKMHPSHQNSLVLSDSDKVLVRKWFEMPLAKAGKKDKSSLLEVKNLTFGYDSDRTNLENISFSLNEGEMVSIVGRNGAGKSTLSKLICGFETPRSGSILLKGRNLAGDTIKERATSIGYVMQNPNQMISQSMIFDEVALGLRTRGLPEEDITHLVHEALRICGLYPFRSWPVSALSFGQKKRVTIASVLVMQPQILILDEPTAGQDFRRYTDIMEFLRQLNAQGYTVIMVTHDMHLMLEYTPRALVFNEGHLIADLAPSKLLCDPQLVDQAALKETSLFSLAEQCGIENASDFVQHFIDYDREVRS
ncbi:ABC superfamily ATP binding cassette transporter, ABC protein [gut metagenome]|uniref:ABC superfamily ATP binding cassette transporter, ABC protein n=1 Tax=gut metagenome TaxID=749906 RepID=J9GGJ5_9ZZZZ